MLFVLGILLVIVAPLLGPLPGPGGIPCALAGLTLMMRNSSWARRRYVRLKRRFPKHGAWVDWGLRRGSARRRKARKAIDTRASVDSGALPR